MAAHAASVYVEIDIRSPVDEVWARTQDPALHERWDLRFTEIRYLSRPDDAAPQRFLYATRIGLGLRVRGEGESVGRSGDPGQARTSALKFWSSDPKSLIREGSGYWQYVPRGDEATRFLTRYDYAVRFGPLGCAVDRWMFRPLLGWATAWSFDRLRLWIEEGVDPGMALRLWLVHLWSRLGLAFVFVYHGLVPKLIVRHADELAMLGAAGVGEPESRTALIAIGVAEVALGVLIGACWRWRWPLWVAACAMPVALLGVGATSPDRLLAPFNPVTLNVLVAAVAAIALLTGRGQPSARRCRRQPSPSSGGAS